MKRIGIMGGSFNPVHKGHIAVAMAVVESGLVDEVWLVLSPLNPLKQSCGEMVSDSRRLEMLRIAAKAISNVKVSDVELSLPRPSYTIDTLRHLAEVNPENRFVVIIGSDNWAIFNKWKDYGRILSEYGVIVYPRPGFPVDEAALPDNVSLVDAPVSDVSSTEIRGKLREGTDANNLLPCGVYEYIKANNLYEGTK